MVQSLVEFIPTLINCCNALGDNHAALQYLRRMFGIITEVYPPNYPEIADYAISLAESLQRSAARAPRTAAASTRECRSLLQKSVDIRSVALGADHPLTLEAKESLI